MGSLCRREVEEVRAVEWAVRSLYELLLAAYHISIRIESGRP